MNTYMLLLARGFEVILLPVILGFIGAVYKSTVSALPALASRKHKKKS